MVAAPPGGRASLRALQRGRGASPGQPAGRAAGQRTERARAGLQTGIGFPALNAGYRLSMRGHRGATAYVIDSYGSAHKIRISPYDRRGFPLSGPDRLPIGPIDYRLAPITYRPAAQGHPFTRGGCL